MEGPLANAGVHVHIKTNGLICRNGEWLRLGADMFAQAVLHIQNIRAGRERQAITPLAISRNRFDCFFLVVAQDDQGVFGIGFRRNCRRGTICKFNRFRGVDV